MNHPAVRPRLGSLSGEGKKNYLLRGHLSKMPWKNCSVELVANWLNIEWTRRNKLVTGINCKFNPPILLCVSLPGLWGAGVYPSYHEARESLLFPLLSEKKGYLWLQFRVLLFYEFTVPCTCCSELPLWKGDHYADINFTRHVWEQECMSAISVK